MTLWRRFESSGLKNLVRHSMKRHFLLPVAGAPSACTVDGQRGRSWEEPFPPRDRIFSYIHFRSFAAPAQANIKPKIEGKGGDWRKPRVEEDGIRINEAINDPEVRLVTDQGHRIVSIQEALYLARKLDVDLVEVQRKVGIQGGAGLPVYKPAVCKLMDYYKEKYKQDVKGKERAKSKASIALRSGENKEVRIKAKTEPNDLKIKAESIRRLMERGYRVKCTVMPKGKDDEDLGGLLLNLLSLIEDVSIVDSGPHLDTKNVYVIVKHIKFGSKKGKKISKVVETVSSALSAHPNAAAAISSAGNDWSASQTEEVWDAIETDSETDSETESEALSEQAKTNIHSPSGSHPASPLKSVSHSHGAVKDWSGFNEKDDINAEISFHSKHTSSKFGGTTSHSPSQSAPNVVESNRYSKGSSTKGTVRYMRPTNSDAFAGRIATGNQGRMPEQTSRNEIGGHPQLNPKDQPVHTHNPSSSSSGYGIFSASQNSGSFDRSKVVGATLGKPNAPNVPQQTYGASSTKSSSSADQPHMGEVTMDRVSRSNSQTSSYGIFSTPKTVSSDDQMKHRDAAKDNSSRSTPGYGIYNSAKPIGSHLKDATAGRSSNANPPLPRFGNFISSK